MKGGDGKGYIGLLDKKYSPKDFEPRILRYWSENKIYDKIRAYTGRPKYYFLDGPPYPSSDVPHIGTAWNKIMKDVIIRYRRMKGYATWDQPGYDTHGLPIEVAVEKKLGLMSKRDIEEKLGVEKFITECRELAYRNSLEMSRHFWELGVSMDWSNPYYTFKNEYIEASWWLIKKAHERGLLDRGLKVVWWCPRCETVLADYEVSEYKDLSDPSIYVKFPLSEGNSNLLIWTTTPWTLPANVFVMAHPDEYYVEVLIDGEKLILMESLLGKAIGDREYKVLRRFKGSELEGMKYRHPLEGIVKAQERVRDYHIVVMAPEFVSGEEGTGLVHSAPGHGEEDYMVGSKMGFPVISLVDERGRYLDEAGKYGGMEIFEANQEIIRDLKKLGALFREDRIVHRYPVCWRCKTRLIIRATQQWFLKVTNIKDELIEAIKKVEIIPDWGYDRFINWLSELRDWVISRQRYWGIPIPIWVCRGCGDYIVIGGLKELKEMGADTSKIEDLHRPWIDKIILNCRKCGGEMHRVEDVMDVWFDSGVSFFASLGYPMREKPFKDLYPVDFITEGHDQIRGWFFSLLRAGVIGFNESPYKRVVIHGFVLDEKGREMHKSLGNYVAPTEVIERFGRDVLRYGVLQHTIWEDLKFSWKSMELAFRELNILWNTYLFASLYMNLDRYRYEDYPIEKYLDKLYPEDRWILSRINSVVKEAGEMLEKSLIHEAIRIAREFFLEDLSRRYIRLVRWRTWLEGEDVRKISAYSVLYYTLFKLLKLLAPFIPFITEEIYLKMFRPAISMAYESIHMYEFPDVDESLINPQLEEAMDYIDKVLEAGGAARMEAGVKIRVPLKNLYILSDSEKLERALDIFGDVVKSQLNVKNIHFSPTSNLSRFMVKIAEPNLSAMGPVFRGDTPKVVQYISERAREVAKEIAEKGYAKIVLDGSEYNLTKDMVNIVEKPIKNYVVKGFEYGYIVLDRTISEEEVAEGLARDIVRRIQFMRKELDLPIDAYIRVIVSAPDERAISYIESMKSYIMNETRAKEFIVGIDVDIPEDMYTRDWELSGDIYRIAVKQI